MALDMKPHRVDNMPDAVYWATEKIQSGLAIIAGAYLVVHGHPITGTALIVFGCL